MNQNVSVRDLVSFMTSALVSDIGKIEVILLLVELIQRVYVTRFAKTRLIAGVRNSSYGPFSSTK